nr:unnamed protein product [Spirometra erinaceieuropaei]
MRQFIFQSFRWYSKTPFRKLSQEFDLSSKPSTHPNSSNPGWFPPHIWLLQRNENEALRNAFFPSTSRPQNGSECISTGVAHISGKPIDRNIRYDTVENLCYRTYIRPVALFGGERPDRQVAEVGRGCHLTIATPGRLLDFLDRELLNLSHCRTLIIDEADRLLDMGFEPQLRKVLQSPAYGMPPAEDNQRQTALFSATFPREVALLARDFLRGPSCISLNVIPQEQAEAADASTTPHLIAPAWGEAVRRPSSEETLRQLKASVPREIVQTVEWIESDIKLDRLKRLTSVINRITQEHLEAVAAKAEAPTNITRVLVFCNTKREADMVDHYLTRQGLKSIDCFSACQVAARGLDFPSVKAVINYSLPLGLDDYVHRIGRTGRMGSSGLAVTLTGPDELRREAHLQQVARGICTLASQGNSAVPLPAEFISAARWRKGQELEDAPTSFNRQAPCSPVRLNRFRPKRSFGQRT